jgi:sugar O-acyltransferase (sialic acid O-acetyltransferase NeuD family)
MTRALPPMVIVGAGGHGRSVLELVRLLGTHEVPGFLDDLHPPGTDVMGVPVWGPTTAMASLSDRGVNALHVAIGNNAARAALHARARDAGLQAVTLIHPRACVSPSASLGAGCAVMALAVVGTEARLGDGVIVNVGAAVDHHARVGHHGHLGANATMAGGTSIGTRAWLQAGSAIGYHVHLPDDTIVPPGESRA